MTKLKLSIFLKTLSKGLATDKHIDTVHNILSMMTTETMEKFIAYDLFKDLLLKEKQNAASETPTPPSTTE